MRRGASALVNLEVGSMTPLLTPRHDNSMEQPADDFGQWPGARGLADECSEVLGSFQRWPRIQPAGHPGKGVSRVHHLGRQVADHAGAVGIAMPAGEGDELLALGLLLRP